MLLEVIVTNAQEARLAEHAGASRVELVTERERGGLTPDERTVAEVIASISIPVHVMLRPRTGSYAYDESEREDLLRGSERLTELGAAAIVFGALDLHGDVDRTLMEEICARSRSVTFHRAFDHARDYGAAYSLLALLPGVDRILTSGGAASAWDGRNVLRSLKDDTGPILLAGGGITLETVTAIVAASGVHEIHIGGGARTGGVLDPYKIERFAEILMAIARRSDDSTSRKYRRHMLGVNFEREIREQPFVWDALARSDKAEQLAGAIRQQDVVLIGSGSSLFVSQLGALALRRRGINAHALAATEAGLDNVSYRGAAVIACSQSGRSSDLLAALDILKPKQLIALTNTSDSPLAERANLCIDVGSDVEVAVPASKSVTATAALLLWAAGLVAGKHERSAATLSETAEDVRAWLDNEAQIESIRAAAQRISRRRSVIIVATAYGLPIAHEFALKLKEASYIHAEGFSAGEFRHGSAAMLDASCAIIGIVDESSRAIVNRPLLEAAEAESLRYVVGSHLGDIPVIGPVVREPFNTLAWFVTAQMLALHVGRARYVESDAPRGLMKALV